MSQTFECSNCGAPLEYRGAGRVMKCSFCNGNAEVPEALWQAAESARQQLEMKQAQKKWVKFLWIFLAVTVGLPLCGSLIGVLAGIFGTIVGILAPFLSQ